MVNMERLTIKKEDNILIYYHLKPDTTEDAKIQKWNYYSAIDKLGQLEDIEEKLGIDLITLYKALTNGVWVKNEVGQPYHTNIYLYNLILSPSSVKKDFCFITSDNVLLSFGRIKQDWALTSEELADE